MPRTVLAALAVALLVGTASAAAPGPMTPVPSTTTVSNAGHRGCGCRGWPDYRAPNGKCAGQKDLIRVCGNPPTTRCKREN